MNPTKYDFTIYQGTSWEQEITFSQEDGNPMDFTNFQGRSQVKAEPNGEKLADIVVTFPEPTTGKMVLTMDAVTTAAISTTGANADDMDKYVYDVEIYDSTEHVFRILYGTASISPEVTR